MDRRRLTPIRDELVTLRNTVVALAEDCANGSRVDHSYVHGLHEIADHLDHAQYVLTQVAVRATNDEADAVLYPDEVAP